MNPQDIEEHIDAKLLLAMIDNYDNGAVEPMSRQTLARKIGVSVDRLGLIESDIYKKLREHPSAWEAITLLYRTEEPLD